MNGQGQHHSQAYQQYQQNQQSQGQQAQNQQPQIQGQASKQSFSVNVPLPDFEMHPAVTTMGRITDIVNEGMVTKYGDTFHSVYFEITCASPHVSVRETDGLPHSIRRYTKVSGHPESNFYKIRKAVLGRDLKSEEIVDFNTEDYMGKLVNYTVVHQVKTDGSGQEYAKVDSVTELTVDQVAAMQQQEAQQQAQHQQQPPVEQPAQQESHVHPDSTGGDDFPF